MELRRLAAWDRRVDEVKEAAEVLREARRIAAEASAKLAELRSEIRETCPLELDDLEYQFWSKVDVIDDADSCWEWGGSRNSVPGEEYGRITVQIGGEKHNSTAHRIAYLLTHGVFAEHTRHTCDNPPCCRPSHLLDGTHADNMRDRSERGRVRGKSDQRGEKNDYAVLTDDLVRQARTLYRQGLSQAKIAKQLNASKDALGFAIRGKTWTHITDVPPIQEHEKRRGSAKLSKAQVEEIRKRRAAGENCKDLGAQYGVTESNIAFLTRDMALPRQQGRRKRGPLTPEEIASIREARKQNVSCRALAEQYNVSSALISQIGTGRAHRHVSTS